MSKKKDVVEGLEMKDENSVKDLPGVGAATAEKLKEAGFTNMISIAVASTGELVEAAGVGEAVARKIINTARDKLKMGFESGHELLERSEKTERITTGSKALDKLLGGGIETGTITECYGAFSSGKSQIAHQIAVNAQLPKEKGGINGAVVFLDTESTFRPERIKQLAEAQGLDFTEILKNIRVARCFNSDHQVLLTEKISELVEKEGLPVKLIIVDSLMSLFRSDYIGRGSLADRQQKINKHIHTLQRLANMYNLAVYVTNQVMAKPDTFFGDPTEPVGGHIVGHGMNPRVYLRKGKKGTRVAKMVDSSYLPECEVVYMITPQGIRDVEGSEAEE
ncbi:MAG: DNA repair and recombination protein RadA [Candidatus Nanoarchaeia archaeon]|nr:DNA repair and recombination protein RadA [Candidatus Nanoarchaeia archaeon]MDD5588046.1 DNA repair and recombination protein RadA [Candidatus Nanoarchaeia archaeon]